MNTDKIKKMASLIEEIEQLEEDRKTGFLAQIERFGSSPKRNEFKIVRDYYCGSGIAGSVAEHMTDAVARAEKAFNLILDAAAEEKIKQLSMELVILEKGSIS